MGILEILVILAIVVLAASCAVAGTPLARLSKKAGSRYIGHERAPDPGSDGSKN